MDMEAYQRWAYCLARYELACLKDAIPRLLELKERALRAGSPEELEEIRDKVWQMRRAVHTFLFHLKFIYELAVAGRWHELYSEWWELGEDFRVALGEGGFIDEFLDTWHDVLATIRRRMKELV